MCSLDQNLLPLPAIPFTLIFSGNSIEHGKKGLRYQKGVTRAKAEDDRLWQSWCPVDELLGPRVGGILVWLLPHKYKFVYKEKIGNCTVLCIYVQI